MNRDQLRNAAAGVARRLGLAGRAVGRGGATGARAVGRGGVAATQRFRSFAAADGAQDTGLARLTELHLVNVAGDAALTVSLAGTVFAMPVGEARSQVALFLLLTMAPFVILAPLVGPLLDRFRHGRRWALGGTLALRAFLAWVLAGAVVTDSAWLFPAALGALVASRAYAVARAAAVPRLLPPGIALVAVNARLTIAGLVGMVLGGGLAGAVSRIGPDWSLRLAFVIYVVATVLAIRLPGRVDSPLGETELDGTGQGPEPLPGVVGRRARLNALPPAVRYGLWLTAGARLLGGFNTLFLLFLMREHPFPGWSGTLVLGLVIAAAGIGNALGSVLGNHPRAPAPEVLASAVAWLGVLATLATALVYSLPTLLLVGLVAGVFGQLAKLSLDALVQRDVPEEARSRVFSWSETMLQSFWVVGGGLGIALPLNPALGYGLVTACLLGLIVVALRSRRLGARR